MDGQYQETWKHNGLDEQMACAVKDGGKGRHTLAYKSQCEKKKIRNIVSVTMQNDSWQCWLCLSVPDVGS